MKQSRDNGGAQWRWWPKGVIVASVLVVTTAVGIGSWSAWSRGIGGGASRAAEAYAAGKWQNAAEFARQVLAVRKNDPLALRVLARASARLGRTDGALAIYERRLDAKTLEAEDHLLVGLAHYRLGRVDVAARKWREVIAAKDVPPRSLEELARLEIDAHLWDDALLAIERLRRVPGWEARASMIEGAIRLEHNNIAGAASSFRHAIELDPAEIDIAPDPARLRKVIARTFLRIARPADAANVLRPIIERGPDQETHWLLSRVHLQEDDTPRALTALKLAGSYRAANPLEPEPGAFVGEARCEQCHPAIFRDSLASRHTQTFYRGSQLAKIPLPPGPLPDPDDPEVTHRFQKRDGMLQEETRVGSEVFDAVIDYAFGTADRYLTTISRDPSGGYHIARMSYYQTLDGKGWDRSSLDLIHPNRAEPARFQGDKIQLEDGVPRCLYCHVTNPSFTTGSPGPEMADRAIGCERCHGPGGNHILAIKAGFPDKAIVNPAIASPEAVTIKQCNDCHVLRQEFQDQEPDNPGWVRSQGVGWMRSRCNTESGGKFGCVTCHDPHQSARAIKTAEYESKCLSCHVPTSPPAGDASSGSSARVRSGRTYASCPKNPKSGCIACHMPPVWIDSLHMNLTDHYIRLNDPKH